MPFVLRLILRNAFRHKLRTTLTMTGIVVAIVAFGLLRTIVDAWYAGANASSSARLVTRSAVSLVFSLPLTYAQKIRQVPGVRSVSWANWFGGVYVSERNFFPQFAIDAPTYLDMYPEFILSPAERKAFMTDRKGAVVGRKLARSITPEQVRELRARASWTSPGNCSSISMRRPASYRLMVAPESAVHDGASLAGNDSAELSWTTSLARQPPSASRSSIQWRATCRSRRPIAARTASVEPSTASNPPPKPPRRAPSTASAEPQAAAIQRSWS